MFKLLFNIVDIFSYSSGKKLVLTIANIFTFILCFMLRKWSLTFTGALIPLKYIFLLIIFITLAVVIIKQIVCFIATIKDFKDNLPVNIVNIVFSSLFILMLCLWARKFVS